MPDEQPAPPNVPNPVVPGPPVPNPVPNPETPPVAPATTVEREPTESGEPASLNCADFEPGKIVAGMKITELVYFTCEYVVVLCEGNQIYYEFGERYSYVDDAGQNVEHRISDLLVKAEVSRMRPVRNLRPETIRAYHYMIAQAFVAIFAKRFELAENTLNEASQLRTARTQEIARLFFLVSSVVMFAVSFLVVHYCGGLGPVDVERGTQAALAGALGAVFFSMIRRGSLVLDGEAWWVTHFADGVVRVMVGLISGLVALAALDSKLILGLLENKDGAPPGSILFLLAFVSGYSERLIPSLISEIDDRSSRRDPVLNAPAPAPIPAPAPGANPAPARVVQPAPVPVPVPAPAPAAGQP